MTSYIYNVNVDLPSRKARRRRKFKKYMKAIQKKRAAGGNFKNIRSQIVKQPAAGEDF